MLVVNAASSDAFARLFEHNTGSGTHNSPLPNSAAVSGLIGGILSAATEFLQVFWFSSTMADRSSDDTIRESVPDRDE